MHSDRLGTAQWADPLQFAKGHRYREGGIFLGRGAHDRQLLGVQDDRHVLLVAGTRSGKGTSSIVPNACLWPGSLIVVDPTGDVATLAAGRRGRGGPYCEGMDQQVHVLDPYGVSRVESCYLATFNPLDAIDSNSRSLVRDVEAIAGALVPDSKESEAWALNGARRLIVGLILHVLTDPHFDGRRNLVTVRELICRGDKETEEFARQAGDVLDSFELLWAGMRRNPAARHYISSLGEEFARMSQVAPKQWTGVHDVALAATNFINNDDMRECLSSSSFALQDLKGDARGMSVFITIPSRNKLEDFRWLRLMVSLIMTEMEANASPPASGHATLMVIDEFASLQKMERIESGMSELAKHGLKIFIVLQNLPQLKNVYGDGWEIFWSACGTKILFGIDDQFSREYISKQIGDTEVTRVTGAETEGGSTSQTDTNSRSESRSEQKSRSRGHNDTYKRAALGLRDTAGIFRKLAGNVEASDSRDSSVSSGSATETGFSRATTTATERSSTRTEQLHRRPLVTPDEIGKLFRRVAAQEGSPLYPGVGIGLLSTYPDPVYFRRANYFEDETLEQKYMPPDGKAPPAIVRPDVLPQGIGRDVALSHFQEEKEILARIVAGISILGILAVKLLLAFFSGARGVDLSRFDDHYRALEEKEPLPALDLWDDYNIIPYPDARFFSTIWIIGVRWLSGGLLKELGFVSVRGLPVPALVRPSIYGWIVALAGVMWAGGTAYNRSYNDGDPTPVGSVLTVPGKNVTMRALMIADRVSSSATWVLSAGRIPYAVDASDSTWIKIAKPVSWLYKTLCKKTMWEVDLSKYEKYAPSKPVRSTDL